MKPYGRTFNHLEDLVFFYGYDGTLEAIQHIKEITNNTSSVRMKWDGGLQIYWGREYVNGPLIMNGHNGWSRGYKCTTPDELYNFIINLSGKDRENASDERKKFALKFGSLFQLLDAATPQDFVGFVYADALYLNKPDLYNDEYNFCPNHTSYYVHKDTSIGKRIEKSEILLVGHAYFNEFGISDNHQEPLNNFDQFNRTNEVIILNPYYSNNKIKYKLDRYTECLLLNLATHINDFLAPINGVSSFRDYIYKYMNYKMKNKLNDSFVEWMTNKSMISLSQQDKIKKRIEEQVSGNSMFMLIDEIASIKNILIEELENHDCDIKAHNPEGWVVYSNDKKQFGHIKLVPRHAWTP